MNDRMDDKQVRRYVDAFADGELDVEQSLRVLERMAMDPRTTKRVLHQQQLRQRTARAMEQPKEAPEALRQQIEQLAATVPSDSDDATDRSAVVARFWRWLPLSAAAVVLLVASLLAGLIWQGYSPFDTGNTAVLTNAQVNDFAKRHMDCRRHVDDPQQELFPAQLGALTPEMEKYFNQALQTLPLDLSSFGYRFTRAEECHALGAGAVHLMYERQREHGKVDELSIWLRPVEGQPRDMKPGRLYVAADGGHAHPMVMWHYDGMLFGVMGDSMKAVKQTALHLRSGPGGPCDF